jgi:ABC-type transport system involved in cytochrome bd biosynthesis fused ATPase/permease subunit
MLIRSPIRTLICTCRRTLSEFHFCQIVLRMPMNFLPIVMVYLVQVHVSMKRINKYMNSEELDPKAISHNKSKKEAVVIKDGTFKWDKESDQGATLSNINISVKQVIIMLKLSPILSKRV